MAPKAVQPQRPFLGVVEGLTQGETKGDVLHEVHAQHSHNGLLDGVQLALVGIQRRGGVTDQLGREAGVLFDHRRQFTGMGIGIVLDANKLRGKTRHGRQVIDLLHLAAHAILQVVICARFTRGEGNLMPLPAITMQQGKIGRIGLDQQTRGTDGKIQLLHGLHLHVDDGTNAKGSRQRRQRLIVAFEQQLGGLGLGAKGEITLEQAGDLSQVELLIGTDHGHQIIFTTTQHHRTNNLFQRQPGMFDGFFKGLPRLRLTALETTSASSEIGSDCRWNIHGTAPEALLAGKIPSLDTDNRDRT